MERPDANADRAGGHFDTGSTAHAQTKPAPDYGGQIAPIFTKYCSGCHNDEDREGKFSLESFGSLQKGTEKGPAFLRGRRQGKPDDSRADGRAPSPPCRPRANRGLNLPRSRSIAAWIDAGAHGPKGEEPDRLALIVPTIPSHTKVRPIVAMDSSRDGKWLAVARTGRGGPLQDARAGQGPARSSGAIGGQVPGEGHCAPFHGRRLEPDHGVGCRRPGRAWRRSGTSPTVR